MKILAFGHRMRTGKDTAAMFAMQYLRCNTKVSCCRCSFGDEIKTLAHQMYRGLGLEEGIYYENRPQLKDQIIPSLKKSPRQIWIELGLKGREIWPYTWPELAISKVDSDIAVVPDLRDWSEIEYGQKFDAVFVRLNRGAAPKRTDGIDEKIESFTGWHHEIQNEGSLKDLNRAVTDIVKSSLKAWGYV